MECHDSSCAQHISVAVAAAVAFAVAVIVAVAVALLSATKCYGAEDVKE
jgi:hypothetical protein